MTFLTGFTLVTLGAVVGFAVAAIAASSGMADERAAHARSLQKAVKRGDDMERRYLALLESNLRRKHNKESLKN